MIRLQRDVKEKSTKLVALQDKYSAMEEVSRMKILVYEICNINDLLK